MKIERNLTELKVGEKAIISSLDHNEVGIKLMEMGCLPGCEVKVKFKAPLGDPICYCIQGYNLLIRKKEAENVKITLLDSNK